MLCVCIENTDPWFCLAAEEYFLKNFSEEIFMLWQSIDTVVVGKHQNVLAEINYPYTLKHNIKIARRISGGGTVFHDSGKARKNLFYALPRVLDELSSQGYEMVSIPMKKYKADRMWLKGVSGEKG